MIAAYEEANREKSIVGLRHGIDHSLMIRPEHIAAAKRLGLVMGAEENMAENTESISRIYGADEVVKMSPIRSMIDAGIFEGDIALIAPELEPMNGDIVIALIDDEATVKRFFLAGSMVRLVPENSEMEPMVFPAEDVRILGKVKGILRQL